MRKGSDLMPELAEVETVKETLKPRVVGKTIAKVTVYWNHIIEFPSVPEFEQQLIGQTIHGMRRRGKWIIFDLDHYQLLSHLRMEGKYLFRTTNDPIEKHEHVVFQFTDGSELRYHDTRKFGKMHLLTKEEQGPLLELGLEPWDLNLTKEYLKTCYARKKLPIKSVLLDQSIIVGIGNIYADEVLFQCNINPVTRAMDLDEMDLQKIIVATQTTLEKAIAAGGTTIRSFTSAEGVHGKFSQNLLVHGKDGEPCPICGEIIYKTKVGGRGTYYCPNCQK